MSQPTDPGGSAVSQPVHVGQPAPGTHRAGPAEAWLRRWPLAVALVVVGVAAGVGASSLHQTTYTAEARVAVGAGDLSSGAIAGFPLAASQLASNYARYVNDRAMVGGGRVALAASPITDSNVIRIEGRSTSADAARDEVQGAAKSLVQQVKKSREDDTTLPDFVAASQAWAQAQASQQDAEAQLAELRTSDASRARIAAAQARLAELTSETDVALLEKQALGEKYTTQASASTAADLEVVTDATLVSDDSASTRQRYGLLGGVLGLALSLVLAVALEKRHSRGRRSN